MVSACTRPSDAAATIEPLHPAPLLTPPERQLYNVAPFLLALIPWYSVLDFDEAIEQTHAATQAAIQNASQSTFVGSHAINATLALRANDALNDALVKADAYRYRTMIASHVQGSMLGITLAIVPALRKACTMWKFIVPESSLWGHGIRYLPYLSVMTSIISWVYWNQGLAHSLFTGFVLLSSFSSYAYAVLMRGVNSAAQRVPNAALFRETLPLANKVYLAVTIAAYTLAVAYVVVILAKFHDDYCAVLPGACAPLQTHHPPPIAHPLSSWQVQLWKRIIATSHSRRHGARHHRMPCPTHTRPRVSQAWRGTRRPWSISSRSRCGRSASTRSTSS